MNEVITVKMQRPEIVEITLEDRINHNMFSKELTEGLTHAFNSLPPEAKVVIVHGYENYFCSGGTEDELIHIYEGKITFQDFGFYRLLLDCDLPTIAAMQGHAIGGGLVFGCYADFIVLTEESIYTANFMNFGFTPGMGATFIIPKKFGETLGNEMLFTGRNYPGRELKERNIQLPVVKRNEVLEKALSIANELIEKPLESLKLLKQNQVYSIKKELKEIIERELKMHDISFKQPEVKEKILKHFKK